MALTLPKLDDLTYERLRLELLGEIPLVSREYTDHNASDPGVLLLELLAAMGEVISYRCDQLPETIEHNFKAMVLDRPEPVTVTLEVQRGTRAVALASLPAGVDLSASLLSEVLAFGAGSLTFHGAMRPEQRDYLLGLSADAAYQAAISALFTATNLTVVVPAGVRVTGALAANQRLHPGAGSTLFETTEEVMFAGGVSAIPIRARHLEPGAGPMPLGVSNGEPAQVFELGLPLQAGALLLDPRREGSTGYNPNPRVTVGGIPWAWTQTLVDKAPTATVYRVEWLPRSADGHAQSYRFHFGDGRRGAIPASGELVVCSDYQLVKGPFVQVGARALDQLLWSYQPLASLPFAATSLSGGVGYDVARQLLTLDGRLARADYLSLLALSADSAYRAALDSLMELSSLVFANPNPAQGGRHVFGPADLSATALAVLLEPDRAIAARDFQLMATDAYNAASGLVGPRVSRAHATRLDDLGSIALSIIPEPLGVNDRWPVPSLDLLNSVYQFVDERRVITTRVAVTGPVYRIVDVRINVVAAPHVRSVDVISEVTRRVNALFDPLTGGFEGTGWPIGRAVYRSELFQLLRSVAGVVAATVTLDGLPERALVNLQPLELPRVELSAANVTVSGGSP